MGFGGKQKFGGLGILEVLGVRGSLEGWEILGGVGGFGGVEGFWVFEGF